MLQKFYHQISVGSSCFTTVYLTHAEGRNSSERKKYCMSLIKTKRKALYPFCGYFNLVSKQDFSTFWLTEFCREGIFIGRNFMIYAKSFFCFDTSKCCFCNYKLAWKTSQCVTWSTFFSCILLSLQKQPLEVFYKKPVL